MTRAERECANAVIAEVINRWNRLQDGDFVFLLTTATGEVAKSISAARMNKPKDTA